MFMRLGYRLAAGLAVIVACCCLVSGQQILRNPEVAWHSDYAKALAEARQTGKPLFIVLACLH
jgi:hypothetical protein